MPKVIIIMQHPLTFRRMGSFNLDLENLIDDPTNIIQQKVDKYIHNHQLNVDRLEWTMVTENIELKL